MITPAREPDVAPALRPVLVGGPDGGVTVCVPVGDVVDFLGWHAVEAGVASLLLSGDDKATMEMVHLVLGDLADEVNQVAGNPPHAKDV